MSRDVHTTDRNTVIVTDDGPTSTVKSTLKDALKTLVPSAGVEKLRRWRNLLRSVPARVLGRLGLLSALYYGLPGSAFAREHHGVMYGRMKYYQELETANQSHFLLRRNVHRLEKGLIMSPRRDVFATSYIQETVDCFERSLRAHDFVISDGSELKWAHDVLLEFFQVTASDPIIDRARSQFRASVQSLRLTNENGPPLKPYKRNLSARPPVRYDDLRKLAEARRSVRWYLAKQVPRELIDQAITLASLAPSACNRQPFEFRVFDEPQLTSKIAALPGGTMGFSHNFPVVVVVIGQLRAYFSERDRHLIYIDGALASMSFMYALETLGLSSCPINWPDEAHKERRIRKLLGLEPDERPIMLMSLGYPDPAMMVPFSQKRPLDQLRTYNNTGKSRD